MPEFKKSTGYKMKGYSYPGESPLKGKKRDLKQQQARDAMLAAQEQMAAFGQRSIGKKAPLNQKEKVLKIEPKKIQLIPNQGPKHKLEKATKTHDMVLSEMKAERKHKRIQGFKDKATDVAGKIGEQVISNLISRGINALIDPPKKRGSQVGEGGVTAAPNVAGFSKMKFGRG